VPNSRRGAREPEGLAAQRALCWGASVPERLPHGGGGSLGADAAQRCCLLLAGGRVKAAAIRGEARSRQQAPQRGSCWRCPSGAQGAGAACAQGAGAACAQGAGVACSGVLTR